jgi:acyl carrier protein
MLTQQEQKIYDVIAEQLGVAVTDIKKESRIVDDLGADSLDSVELVMALEDEFELTIDEEQSSKFETVQQVIDFIAASKVPA